MVSAGFPSYDPTVSVLREHQRSKQRCQDLCWKVHDRAKSFVLRSYTSHEYYMTNTFLLVSSIVLSINNYCALYTVKAQKENKKHATKNLVEFHNHSSLLSMFRFRCYYIIKNKLQFCILVDVVTHISKLKGVAEMTKKKIIK